MSKELTNYDYANGDRISDVIGDNFDELKNKIVELKNLIIDAIYPVGSIYITTNNENPANLLGGTWEIVGSGRVLWGVGEDDEAGTELSEQLPNLRGEIGDINARGSSANNIYKNGVFEESVKSNDNNIGCSSPKGDVIKAIKFNASKGSAIYKDNGIVRPNAYTVKYWERTE